MTKHLSEEEKAIRKAARAFKKQVAPAVKSVQESSASVEASASIEASTNCLVVDINGKKYNQIFNPNDGTTHVELIIE